MLADKRVWLLMIPDFSIVIALYGLNLWQPQMVKAMGYSNLETGFIVALPYLLAIELRQPPDRERMARVMRERFALEVMAETYFKILLG